MSPANDTFRVPHGSTLIRARLGCHRSAYLSAYRVPSQAADLDEYFQKDGRWAIAVVVVFMATANVVNVVLFNLVVIGAKRRMIQGGATILFGVWLSLYTWMFVPVTY